MSTSGDYTVGAMLKEGRSRKGWSLRKAELETGISNGYLSLLESDKIKSPSPTYLRRLAVAFDLSYPALMDAVGYPDMFGSEQDRAIVTRADSTLDEVARKSAKWQDAASARNEDGLTPAEWDQVRAFIQGLLAGREKDKKHFPLTAV